MSNVSATPSAIWPPDHRIVAVTINYDVTDDFTPASAIQASLQVSTNEPVNATGDGNTAADIEIVDPHHVRVRAERSGTGDGRIYRITITCMDQAGGRTIEPDRAGRGADVHAAAMQLGPLSRRPRRMGPRTGLSENGRSVTDAGLIPTLDFRLEPD